MGFLKWKFLVIPNREDGDAVFYSGDTLRGRIVIDEEKEKTVRGVYVELKGYCRVRWSSNGGRMEHKSYEEYINNKMYILNSRDGKCKILPGLHEYPYEFTIPQYCPGSYESKIGIIRYELNLVVERAYLSNQVRTSHLTVIALSTVPSVDLNPFPDVKENKIRLQLNKSYNSCCFNSGNVETVVKCPVSGLDQTIPIEVVCENNSSVTIKNIYFLIKEVSTFYATKKTVVEKVVAAQCVGRVAPRGELRRAVALNVANINVINVRNCKFIDIDYYFEVIVKPAGLHKNTSKRQKLNIGTVVQWHDELEQLALPSQTPGQLSQTPELPSQTPDLSSQTPDLSSQTPDLSSETPGLTSHTPDLPSQTPDLTSQTTGLPSQTPGLPSELPVLFSQPPGVPPQQPGLPYQSPALPTHNPGLPSQQPGLITQLPGLPFQQPGLPFQPPGFPFPPPHISYPPNYQPFPQPNPINTPYMNGNHYNSPYYPIYPILDPSTSYNVYPAYPGNGYPAATHQPPPPRFSNAVAPSAPEAEPDTGDNTPTNNN